MYTKALLAYAFALAGKVEKQRALLDSLKKEAVKEGESFLLSPAHPTGPTICCKVTVSSELHARHSGETRHRRESFVFLPKCRDTTASGRFLTPQHIACLG